MERRASPPARGAPVERRVSPPGVLFQKIARPKHWHGGYAPWDIPLVTCLFIPL
jgi:hypothetical protein